MGGSVHVLRHGLRPWLPLYHLLVPDAWKRTALLKLRSGEDDLFAQLVHSIVDGFFGDRSLTLPAGRTWRNVSANVFSVVDGNRLLFENEGSLFHRLRQHEPPLRLLREEIASAMSADEMHDDVFAFVDKLKSMTGTS